MVIWKEIQNIAALLPIFESVPFPPDYTTCLFQIDCYLFNIFHHNYHFSYGESSVFKSDGHAVSPSGVYRYY